MFEHVYKLSCKPKNVKVRLLDASLPLISVPSLVEEACTLARTLKESSKWHQQ